MHAQELAGAGALGANPLLVLAKESDQPPCRLEGIVAL